ncbi:DgyrCDS2368 [Dimorphilus gyrociliatus]|uniref:DgyrCDS2368 n=1 Tax=Dimorphilus gyrociliatus TaxID=2664684 RepID=A0A7I8VA94_9ANNE|nr:DgyrCDS2368 [Dimorphilus gyrociliatus]
MDELREINLIDRNITNLHSLSITGHLVSLNLHSNKIDRIINLKAAVSLQFLDLSSNKIKYIEGLESLVNLRNLNLSCNKIETVTGLHNTKNLVKLDVSHNKISDLSGLRSIPSTKFSILNASGNTLTDFEHVLACLEACRYLKELLFNQGSATNAICCESDYQKSIWNTLPYLHSLDGKTKNGEIAEKTFSFSPHLNEFSEFLHSNSSDTSILDSRIMTPKIDAALEKFRSRRVKTPEISTVSSNESTILSEEPSKDETRNKTSLKVESKERLENIEKQLADLLEKSKLKEERVTTTSSCTQTETNRNKNEVRSAFVNGTKKPAENITKRIEREKMDEKRIKFDYDRLHQAEAASHRLASMVRQLQQTLSEERDKRIECENSLETMRLELKESSEYINQLHSKCINLEKSNGELEKNYAERFDELNKELKINQKENFTISQQVRLFVEILKGENIDLKAQLKAKKEEYEKELNLRLSNEKIDGTQKMKIDMLANEYSRLEDELRIALVIEAETREKIVKELETNKNELSETREALKESTEQNVKSSKMINELTQLVKEQKGRLTELNKCKHEQASDMKDRITELEKHVDEAKRRMIQLELVKKERNDLLAQLTAVKSINEGLKAERKVWSEELAEQGSSLAQERGRLEAKIESLRNENATLAKQLESEVDTVRIKTAIIQDQTSTIAKLKEALLERDAEVKEARSDALRSERDLHDHLENDACVQKDYDDRLERMRNRKDDLKKRVSELEEEVENWRRSHNAIKSQWSEKCDLIVKLEEKVRKLKSVWDEKHKKLNEEKNTAVQSAEESRKNLQAADESFRKQLVAQKELLESEMRQRILEKDREIADRSARVKEVEDEMRELLKDTEEAKAATETKLRKLQDALSSLQTAF